jgi:hypothetical protein
VVFTGDRVQAKNFLAQWNLFARVNRHNSVMTNVYQRCLIFLTYIQGPLVNEWITEMSNWLKHETTIMGVAENNNWLWQEVHSSFLRQFMDTMEEECARLLLKSGELRMMNQNIDEYITRFKKAAQQAGYPLDASLTIDLFTGGVPAHYTNKPTT